MRRVITLAVAGALLAAAPAEASVAEPPTARAAQGVCQCMVKFANRYVHRASYRAQVQRKMARRGIGPRKRRRTRRGIYDWQRDHQNLPNWCRRSEFNRKACRAAIACIGVAGAAIPDAGAGARGGGEAPTELAGAAG